MFRRTLTFALDIHDKGQEGKINDKAQVRVSERCQNALP